MLSWLRDIPDYPCLSSELTDCQLPGLRRPGRWQWQSNKWQLTVEPNVPWNNPVLLHLWWQGTHGHSAMTRHLWQLVTLLFETQRQRSVAPHLHFSVPLWLISVYLGPEESCKCLGCPLKKRVDTTGLFGISGKFLKQLETAGSGFKSHRHKWRCWGLSLLKWSHNWIVS